MEKQQIISFIKTQLSSGSITKEDILGITIGDSTSPIGKDSAPRNLIHILYGIGAIIIITGVAILIGQNWQEIGFVGRVSTTLGISLATYIGGMLFRSSTNSVLSQVLFTISAALAPLGTAVLLDESGIDFGLNTQIAVSSGLFIVFGTALLIAKKNILTLITVGFATWTYYASLIKLFDIGYNNDVDILKWATMFLGFSYILIGISFRNFIANTTNFENVKEKERIQDILYGLGALAVLGAGISIGDYFDIIFIAFIFGAFYASIYLKSRSMLIFSACFLVAHIIKITSEYFANSIGWPISLIGIGFLTIGIGYGTYHLNRKFISPN